MSGRCAHCGGEVVDGDYLGLVHQFSYQQQCQDGAPERAELAEPGDCYGPDTAEGIPPEAERKEG